MRKGFVPSACIKDKSKENRQRDVKRTYDIFFFLSISDQAFLMDVMDHLILSVI